VIALPVVYSNNFENTVSPFGWTGINQTAGIVTVSSDHPYTGSYNAYVTLNAGAVAGSYAGFYQSYAGTPNRAHIFIRAMNVMVDQLPANENGRLPVHGCWVQPSAEMIGNCGFTKVGGVLKWFNYYRHNGTFVFQTGGTPQLNTLYCVELEVRQNSASGVADGAQRLWVNGTLVLEVTGLINDDRIVNYLVFGLMNAEGNATNPIHFWGDSYVVADGYIGPESGNPWVTVNSSPELNVPVYVDGQFIGNTPIAVSIPSGTHTVRVESEVTR